MKIENVEVFGLETSCKAAGYPMSVDTEKNMNSENFPKQLMHMANCPTGTAHDQFMTGIVVNFDMHCSIQLWQEAERYRFLYFVSSQSKMHRIDKFGIASQCNEYVDDRIISICEEKQRTLNALKLLQKSEKATKDEVKEAFYDLIYNIPSGFCYTARMTTNYRQLKTIYQQRRNHRLDEWKVFCTWVESLPMSELITGNCK